MGSAATENNVVVAIEHNNENETNILNQLREAEKLATEGSHLLLRVVIILVE